MNKNQKLLNEFAEFCEKHPELRFWQALRAWAMTPFLLFSTHFDGEMFNNEWLKDNNVGIKDTFYWENKLN